MGSTCRIVLGIAIYLLPGLCQMPPTPAAYELFFRQSDGNLEINGTKVLPDAGGVKGTATPTVITVRTNGGERQMLVTPPPEVLALSEAELQALKTIAAECNARLQAFNQAYRTVVLDARLAQVELGDSAPGPRAILQRLDDEHEQIVLGQVKQLKSVLTEAHLGALENLIRTATPTTSFYLLTLIPADAPR